MSGSVAGVSNRSDGRPGQLLEALGAAAAHHHQVLDRRRLVEQGRHPVAVGGRGHQHLGLGVVEPVHDRVVAVQHRHGEQDRLHLVGGQEAGRDLGRGRGHHRHPVPLADPQPPQGVGRPVGEPAHVAEAPALVAALVGHEAHGRAVGLVLVEHVGGQVVAGRDLPAEARGHLLVGAGTMGAVVAHGFLLGRRATHLPMTSHEGTTPTSPADGAGRRQRLRRVPLHAAPGEAPAPRRRRAAAGQLRRLPPLQPAAAQRGRRRGRAAPHRRRAARRPAPGQGAARARGRRRRPGADGDPAAAPTGRPHELAWDRLVLAPGGVSRTFDIPGVAEHGLGLKTLAEATYLRDHVLRELENADAADDPDRRRACCTFVVVGAGYSGTETAAQMQLVTSRAAADYPRLRPEEHALGAGRPGPPGAAGAGPPAGRRRHGGAAPPRGRGPAGHDRRGGDRRRGAAVGRRDDPDPHPGLVHRRHPEPADRDPRAAHRAGAAEGRGRPGRCPAPPACSPSATPPPSPT